MDRDQIIQQDFLQTLAIDESFNCKHLKTVRVTNDRGEVGIICDNCGRSESEQEYTERKELNG